MVTHDQTEAMALADRLVLMHDGRVQQIGTPEQVHSRPANPFVARFIGGSNIVHGRLDGDRLVLPDGTVLALANRYTRGGEATLAVRPDSMRLVAPRDGCVEAEVELCTWLGAVVDHAVRIGPDVTLLARGPGLGPDAAPRHTAGTRVALRWGAEDERLFDAAGHADAGAISGRQIMREFTLSRRGVLGAAALLAAPAIIRHARAAEQCVVGTWGGDYARLLRENIDDPILKPAGVEVVQDIGDETPRTSKMYAQKKLPHGTMDIACLGAL